MFLIEERSHLLGSTQLNFITYHTYLLLCSTQLLYAIDHTVCRSHTLLHDGLKFHFCTFLNSIGGRKFTCNLHYSLHTAERIVP